MAYKSDPRGTRAVRLVAVHTAEGARTAASLGSYFAQASTQASSHVGIDAGATLQYVDYSRSAWTIRSGNPISDNAELCAFAAFSRAQWLSSAPVNGCANPLAILDRTAAWIRSRCLTRGIPIRKLTPAQVAAGQAGVIGHVDWTLGMHDGTHTDPGAGFPWDYVMNKANAGGGGGSTGGGTPTTPPGPTPSSKRIMLMSSKVLEVPLSMDTTWVLPRVDMPGGALSGFIIRPKLGPGSTASPSPVWLGNVYGWGSGHSGIGAQYNPKNIPGFNLKIEYPTFIAQPGALWADMEYSCRDTFEIEPVG